MVTSASLAALPSEVVTTRSKVCGMKSSWFNRGPLASLVEMVTVCGVLFVFRSTTKKDWSAPGPPRGLSPLNTAAVMRWSAGKKSALSPSFKSSSVRVNTTLDTDSSRTSAILGELGR